MFRRTKTFALLLMGTYTMSQINNNPPPPAHVKRAEVLAKTNMFYLSIF